MAIFRVFPVPVLALFLALTLPVHAQSEDAALGVDTARVIVGFRPGSVILADKALAAAPERGRAQLLGKKLGLAMGAGSAISERAQVVFAAGVTSAALAQRLAAMDDVEYAVPDERRRAYAAPNDPLYPPGVPGNGPAVGQWYLRAPAGDVVSSLDVEPAWAVTTGNPGVVVAVLDTGVRFEHPDLLAVSAGGNLLPGYDMVSDAAAANDGDGRDADASDPGDWVTQAELSQRGGRFFQCTTDPENSSWHGTQVAGLIAALTDNGVGMASVGRTVRVLPVRVLGKCGGFDSDIIAGMRWAAGLAVPGVPANAFPARVINMSLGSAGACSAAYTQAVNDVTAAGTVVVAAAGNAAGHAVGTPASCSGVIAVAALRQIGTKVGFSNLGPQIAISAPGGNCINTDAGTPCLYPILTTTNSGTTTPLASTYTDSFDPSLGTSFSTPLVAGTVALMFSAQPALTPAQVRAALQSTTRPFPSSGGDATVAQCTAPQVGPSGTAIDQLECYCTTATCGAGMLDAGAAVRAVGSSATASPLEVEGLWWNAPAGSESGWGLNLAQQGDVIFATWFTYDASGKAWWLSMSANRTSGDAYAGTLYQTRGPVFSATPFNPAQVVASAVGSATLAFSDGNNGTFAYTVNGIAQTKSITRQVFGALPACTFAAQNDLALASNYQDIWWNAPAASESGWGLNLTEQSNIIFATWFTYDSDGTPLWLSGTATSTAAGVYTGTLYRSTGPAFNAVPFDVAAVRLSPVGALTLSFADGNTGTFAYTVNGVAQTKAITRQVFRAPGTVCH